MINATPAALAGISLLAISLVLVPFAAHAASDGDREYGDGYKEYYSEKMNDTDKMPYGMHDKMPYGMHDKMPYGMHDKMPYGMHGGWCGTGMGLMGMPFEFGKFGHMDMIEDFAFPLYDGSLTVTGSSQAMVEPDTLTIRLGVETTRDTAGAALADNSRLMAAAVDAVLALGIPDDDMSTANFNIYPLYDSQYDSLGNYISVFQGYEVSNTIIVTTDMLNMTSDIIDTAVQAGANRVDSVTFGLAPENEAAVREDLIGEAVNNAIFKAELALEPLGYEIIGVDAVVMDAEYGVLEPLTRFATEIASMSADTSTPIFAGDQTLTASATITFIIGPE